MAKYLMALRFKCKDPSREAEFNEWYEKSHIPDILAQPDFTRVVRWEDIDSSAQPKKYLTLIDIETDNLVKTLEMEQKYITELKAKNHLSDQFVLISRHICELISDTSK